MIHPFLEDGGGGRVPFLPTSEWQPAPECVHYLPPHFTRVNETLGQTAGDFEHGACFFIVKLGGADDRFGDGLYPSPANLLSSAESVTGLPSFSLKYRGLILGKTRFSASVRALPSEHQTEIAPFAALIGPGTVARRAYHHSAETSNRLGCQC